MKKEKKKSGSGYLCDCPDCRVRRLTAEMDRLVYISLGLIGLGIALAFWWSGAWRAVLAWLAWVTH